MYHEKEANCNRWHTGHSFSLLTWTQPESSFRIQQPESLSMMRSCSIRSNNRSSLRMQGAYLAPSNTRSSYITRKVKSHLMYLVNCQIYYRDRTHTVQQYNTYTHITLCRVIIAPPTCDGPPHILVVMVRVVGSIPRFVRWIYYRK